MNSPLTSDELTLDGRLRRTSDNMRLCAHVELPGPTKSLLEGFAKEIEWAARLAEHLVNGEFICHRCGIRKDSTLTGCANEF